MLEVISRVLLPVPVTVTGVAVVEATVLNTTST